MRKVDKFLPIIFLSLKNLDKENISMLPLINGTQILNTINGDIETTSQYTTEIQNENENENEKELNEPNSENDEK